MLLAKFILHFYWTITSEMYIEAQITWSNVRGDSKELEERGSCTSSFGCMSLVLFPDSDPYSDWSPSFWSSGIEYGNVGLLSIFHFCNKWVLISGLEIANCNSIIVIKCEGGLAFNSAFRLIKFNISSVHFKFLSQKNWKLFVPSVQETFLEALFVISWPGNGIYKRVPPTQVWLEFFFESRRSQPPEASRLHLIGFKLDSDQETHISPFRSLDYRKLQEMESTH